VGDPDFVNIGCGMGFEATMYLTSRGVRVTGTDAWSWDAPCSYTAKRVAASGDTSLIWEGRIAGRDIGYCHLEKLHNLEALPGDGFMVCCFPHKIKGASAIRISQSRMPRTMTAVGGIRKTATQPSIALDFQFAMDRCGIEFLRRTTVQ
jgi:kynurenine formamidase